MAHVKVARRSMQEPEWIEIRRVRLERRIVNSRIPVSNWRIRHARQVSECEYEYEDSGFQPLSVGDTMFTPDGTIFLEADAVVPDELNGQPVWLELQTAAEMMVQCCGKWVGGLDPNRERVLLEEHARSGEKLEIRIEGYNRSKPDDERDIKRSGLRGCRQVFQGAALVTVDSMVQAGLWDVQVLEDTMNCSDVREEIREYIKEHLDKALNFLDEQEQNAESYRRGVEAMREYLKKTVFSSREVKGFTGCGRVALVAHSHLDIAYYWRRVHAVQKNARTCLIQLRLMDRYPEFMYAHTQAHTFELLEEYYPNIFEEVRDKIQNDRFELVGGMYVEPDCNVPTAESLIRQCVYGQLYYRDRFNRTANNCWLPDVFGNTWILPQILKDSGMDFFVSNKMSTWNDTNRFPHDHFRWRGIDGTEVRACVPPTHFITWNSPSQVIENWEAFQEKEACKETLNMFGFGDGGSGVTDDMLEYARRLSNVPGMPAVRHIRGDRFLEENLRDNPDLSVWDGELYLEMHRGTFTTKGLLKRRNRELEICLRDAEMLAAFAAQRGLEYPLDDLTQAWKLLLINQFHDILPGTHISPVTRDALSDYDKVEAIADQVAEEASAVLGLRVTDDTAKEQVVLLNTLGWPRRGAVFLEGDFDENKASEGLFSQFGVCSGKSGLWMDIEEIPSFGTKQVALDQENESRDSWHTFEDAILETPLYRAEFNEDGSFFSLVDKTHNREMVSSTGFLNRLAVFHDYPGKYDAWDILPNWQDREDTVMVAEPLTISSAGSVFVELRIGYQVNDSTWNQRIRFFRNDPRIEFDHDVDWHERNRLAKAMFDFNILSRTATCDTSAGSVQRSTHRNTTWEQARFEVCHHKWADLSEGGYGVSILNDGKYGISFNENQVGVSLLRGSVRPDPYADEGKHAFRLALLPHAGTPENAGIPEAAWAFNVPLRAFRGGEISTALMKVDTADIHVQAVKCPEHGKPGLIVRLCEIHGVRGRATLTFNQRLTSACLTNLLEDELPEGKLDVEENTVTLSYRPYQIITLCIQLET